MIISAKPIRQVKSYKKCEECGELLHGRSAVRLYGAAFENDPPWVMYQCLLCTETYLFHVKEGRDREKILAAYQAIKEN